MTKTKMKLVALATVCLLAVSNAFASVMYHFEFSDLYYWNIGDGRGEAILPFTIDLTYPTYVTTTGMAPLGGPEQSTTLGYSVAYAGTSTSGWWAFGSAFGSAYIDDTIALLGEDSFVYYNDLTTVSNYITAPGIYPGGFWGFVGPGSWSSESIMGLATLTVTDSNQVPEPSTAILAVLTLAAFAWVRRTGVGKT